MENNWQLLKLENLVDSISNTFKKEKKEIIFLNTSDVLEGKVINKKLFKIDELPGQAKKKIMKNDILYSEIRPKNRRYAFIDFDADQYVVSTKLMVLRSRKNILPKFLYYYLTSNDTLNILQNLAESRSGTFPQITFSEVKELEIKLPPINIQEKICNFIKCIDDKIELNNEINKTLEEMAQAIFKSWFVDFEPFKDGEFEESELGMIPKGWKTLELSNLGNIATGKTPSKNNLEHFGNEYKFITPKDINGDMFITKSERGLSNKGYEKMKKNMHYKYSIGVSCIGSDLGEVYLNDDDGFTNQQINTLTLNNYKYYPYVYICLKNMKDEFKNMASGSAVPIINKTTFSKIKIIVPLEKYADDFYNKVNAIFDKILINTNQNEALKEIRDTLLPKLISGGIKI